MGVRISLIIGVCMLVMGMFAFLFVQQRQYASITEPVKQTDRLLPPATDPVEQFKQDAAALLKLGYNEQQLTELVRESAAGESATGVEDVQ